MPKKAKDKSAPTPLHVGVLIDESGSMGGLEQTVINGFNEFAGKLSAEESDRPTSVTLAMFDLSGHDDVVRFKFKGIPLDEVGELGPGDYSPRGATPLNDAVLKTVRTVGKQAKKSDDVMIVVLTDGQENSSETSTADLRKLIVAKEKAGWEFIYLGANQDSWETSEQLGVAAAGKAFDFDATPDGTHAAMALAADRVSSFREDRETYEDEKKELDVRTATRRRPRP